MAGREFDVVLYGASGFTGRQAVEYFAREAPAGLRWAIAGRSRKKLEELHAGVPAMAAEAAEQEAIDAIVSRTRIVLSTAGPFRLYSDGVVEACARLGTHYVDITGETVWVRSLIDRYHERCAAEGTRIIPCCGFDCVPSDLGAAWIAERLGGRATEVKAYFQAKAGRANGGTIATLLDGWETGAAAGMKDPFLLSPGAERAVRELERDPEEARFDEDAGAWVGPWIMGVIDTRVVRRSCALSGRDFAYQEYAKFTGAGARWKARAMAALSRNAERLGKWAVVRSALRRWEPGTGPEGKAMDGGWFRCELFARGEAGTARGVVEGAGDPANRITVKCVCEAALALACEEAALPARGGVLTPATGLGETLRRRLEGKGIAFTGE